jgi:hypothetical protein
LITIELFTGGNRKKLGLTREGSEIFPRLLAFAGRSSFEPCTLIVGKVLREFVEGRKQ